MANKISKLSSGIILSLCVAGGLLRAAHAETSYDRIRSGEYLRSFVVVAPDEIKPDERLPTIIALHSALMNGKGDAMRQIFGLNQVMEKARLVAVYPDSKGLSWSDGRGKNDDGVNDVEFVANLADFLVRSGFADPKRLYLLGISNGGMMTYRIACERPGIFAAYAAIGANLPSNVADRCPRGGYSPMLIINSTDDPIVPWEGGQVGRLLHYGKVLSTPDTVEFWRRQNECSEEFQTKPMADQDNSDESTVLAKQYPDCGSGGSVVLMTVEGGGHLPPGALGEEYGVRRYFLGKRTNQDISSADISWKFFRRFELQK